MTSQLRDRSISAVIANTSNAEDVLEECGIDYWFDCNRTLAAACAAAHIDVAALEERLLPSASVATQPADKSISILIDELNSHLRTSIRPAILGVRKAAASVSDARTNDLLTMVGEIEAMISIHFELLRRVMPAVTSDTTVREHTNPEQRVVRDLALQHALLALRVKKAVDLASQLARKGTAEAIALAGIARQLAKEIHHHIRISYQMVMPYLFAMASRRSHEVEPW